MPKKPKLRPCPFCGGEAAIIKNSFPPRNTWRHPSCLTGGCPGSVSEQDEQGGSDCDCSTDEEAAELWNTRASDVLVEAWKRLAKAGAALDSAYRDKERGFNPDFHPLEVERESAEDALRDLDEEV